MPHGLLLFANASLDRVRIRTQYTIMAAMMDSVRDCAQNHPISVAAGLIIALPGTYLYVTGKSARCALGLSCSPSTSLSRSISVYDSHNPLNLQLRYPTSRITDGPTSITLRIYYGAVEDIVWVITSLTNHLGNILQSRWASQFPMSRLIAVAITTALPGAFLLLVGARDQSNSWAAKHQTKIANALHVIALFTVANQQLSIQDLFVAALVMVTSEALRRSLNRAPKDAPRALETLLSQTHDVVAQTHFDGSPKRQRLLDKNESASQVRAVMRVGSKEEEISRLEDKLAVARASEKAKESELKRAQRDFQNIREKLNDTCVAFAEPASWARRNCDCRPRSRA